MRTVRNLALIVVFVSSWMENSFGQVGIGVANPHPRSILDLTNTNNKGLMLPKLTSTPGVGADTNGLMFYLGDALYFRESAGYNIVNPWKYKYNGSTTEAVYFNPTTYLGVGIGINGAVATNMKGNLHVALNGKDVISSGTSAAIFVGDTDASTHLSIDNDEIIVKTNTNTLGILKLQEGNGGTVQIGESTTNTSNLNVFGKVKENGNDLVPAGVIVMWSGALTAIPAGWAICDGTNSTPDLRERFIVGAGSSDNSTVTGTTQYAPGAGGNGNNFITLATTNIPPHLHSVNISTGSSGSHTHNYEKSDNCYDIVASGQSGCWLLVPGTTTTATTGTGAHSHNVVGNTGNTGGLAGVTQSHENRPPYYALAFIMKL